MMKNEEEIETRDFEDSKPSLDDTVEMLDFEADKKVSNEIDEMLDFIDVKQTKNDENEEKAFALETKANLNRAISEPSTENTVRGARDSFVEDFQINIGLIKKRIKKISK